MSGHGLGEVPIPPEEKPKVQSKYEVIQDVWTLRRLAKDTNLECFIRLNGGVRSLKVVTLDSNGSWWILNEIDDTTDHYKNTAEFKEKYPLFFKAMRANGLMFYKP